MRYSLYESPHLLLLQGYSQQHVSPLPRGPAVPRELTGRALDVLRVEGLLLPLAKSAVSSCGHSHPGDDKPVETGWWATPRRAVLDAGGSGASPVLCFQSILHPGYSRRRQERAHPIPGSFSENCLPLSRWCLRPCRALALGTLTQVRPLVQRVDACERLLWHEASSAPCLRRPLAPRPTFPTTSVGALGWRGGAFRSSSRLFLPCLPAHAHVLSSLLAPPVHAVRPWGCRCSGLSPTKPGLAPLSRRNGQEARRGFQARLYWGLCSSPRATAQRKESSG